MKHTFFYDPLDYLPVYKISLIGDFNDWNGSIDRLSKNENGIWSIELELPPGEYKYKFLINDIIKLNDPAANLYLPDDKDEISSIIIINEKGERLYNTQTYTVNIDKYNLSNKIDKIAPLHNLKIFDQINEKVVCRLEFTNVTGIHTVSILWYGPNNEFYNITENILYTPDDQKGKPIILWFWLNIFEHQLPSGSWTLKLFIDGAFIFEDHFTIKPSTYYINKGQILFK